MFSIGTERTDVAGGIVDEAVSYHLVLAFESLAALTSWAAFDVAVVRAIG